MARAGMSRLKGAMLAGLCLLAAACASTAPPTMPRPGPATPAPGQQPGVPAVVNPTAPPTAGRDGLTPPFMATRDIVRVGLLLPFASRPDDARALYQAAELGVFEFGNASTLLIPRESGATAQETETQTRLLMRDGVDVILGPIQRDGVAAAARVAGERRVPVIGFSSDRQVAGNGVYILSFPLEEEVSRIISFAVSKGLRNFALLAADSDYGRRVEEVMRREAAARGATVSIVQYYQRNERAAADAARALAPQATRAGVQAVLIAESGSVLRATGPALLAGGMNLDQVRLLGTGVWAGGEAQREPTLARGWYAAPDPNVRESFEAKYRAQFNRAAPRIASQGFDALAVAAQLTRDGKSGLSRAGFEKQDGFSGADGIFRFRTDGSIERALAVLEVRPTGPAVIDPAPRRFAGPAS
jgi:ABC-type branched-subunit amino acid transport system substrate-binding protein